MIRAALSVVAVLLLAVAGIVIYTHHFWGSQKSTGNELTAAPTPPPPLPTPVQPVTPAPAPQPVRPVVAPEPVRETPPTPPAAPTPAKHVKRTHIVQAGESLSSISKKYYGTESNYAKLADANGLRRTSTIRIGQVLVLPELAVVKTEPTVAVSTDEPETPAENEPVTASGNNQDFEPQPPTLNVSRPRK
jgi:LysM repeat protein